MDRMFERNGATDFVGLENLGKRISFHGYKAEKAFLTFHGGRPCPFWNPSLMAVFNPYF